MKGHVFLLGMLVLFIPNYASGDFEKMVAITFGVVLTTVTCVGMFAERCKKNGKKRNKPKVGYRKIYNSKFYDTIKKERF